MFQIKMTIICNRRIENKISEFLQTILMSAEQLQHRGKMFDCEVKKKHHK